MYMPINIKNVNANASALAWAKRRFGANFAQAAAKSPTFMADLRMLKRHQSRIFIVPHRTLAYFSGTTIYIGTHGGFLYQLLSLAHEKFHVINQTNTCPDARKISRKEYVKRWLKIEADAETHALRVLDELIAAGQKVVYRTPQKRVRRYQSWKENGQKSLVQIMARTKISTTGETYRQSLTRTWQQANGLPYRQPRRQNGKQFGV
jgi:hypothetical protein